MLNYIKIHQIHPSNIINTIKIALANKSHVQISKHIEWYKQFIQLNNKKQILKKNGK